MDVFKNGRGENCRIFERESEWRTVLRVGQQSMESVALKEDTVHRAGRLYEGWNFNSGNYLFTTDIK